MSSYRALVVKKNEQGEIVRELESRQTVERPDGFVRVRIKYSALNYKDALAATGNPGVALNLPLVPGIDAVGQVIESQTDAFRAGDWVHVAHPDFGTRSDGGFRELADLPETWLFPIPAGLTPEETIILGTAGFTAAQCVRALVDSGLQPEDGEVVVTGSTGGVGIFAVMLLHQLGYSVVASTGKIGRADELLRWGASRVISRAEVNDESSRPLLSAKWSGAVDTVGGVTLSTLLRSTKPHHVVTACGLVGGNQLNMTVYPFILRGVTLVGIDSALISRSERMVLWQRLAKDWRLPEVERLMTIVSLDNLEESIAMIMRGDVFGRVIVAL